MQMIDVSNFVPFFFVNVNVTCGCPFPKKKKKKKQPVVFIFRHKVERYIKTFTSKV